MAGGKMSVFFLALFISAIACATAFGLGIDGAVYSLSFWHYYVYWLAYLFCAVPLAAFKRDAILMKSVAMLILGLAYFSGEPNILSVFIVTLGFSLNTYSAMIVGSDRSYYGYEVGRLPSRLITSFPYSMSAHPMIIGNIVAFGGTLIDADFRERWWPLAIAHIAMNFGLLFMETSISAGSVTDRSFRTTSIPARFLIGLVGVLLGAAIGYVGSGPLHPFLGVALGVVISSYAFSLFVRYSSDQHEAAAHHAFLGRGAR
jgi:Phospholipid methyltransferase